MTSTPRPEPFREPLGTTLLRTVGIAVVVGGVIAWRWGGLARWPVAILLVLWFSFGGHWLELFFLNWLRPRLPVDRPVQVVARLAAWFVGGAVLATGMVLTARSLGGLRAPGGPVWLIGGLGLIGAELLVHLLPRMRGKPSFYDGRG